MRGGNMNYLTEIKAIRETKNGTDMIVHVPKKVANKIIKYRHCGKIYADLLIDDKRRITDKQRRKIYALIGDISKYTGHDPEWLKKFFKFDFIKYVDVEYFSLSRRKNNAASITVARLFINYLIDFILKENIPLTEIALDRTEDIDAYLYLTVKYRKCCICGKSAELHHVNAIGMGRDRNKIDDSNLEKMALCRKHHTEAHKIGVETFNKKYHIYGIKVNELEYKEWYEIRNEHL